MSDPITNFFKPGGVALIGASSNPKKLSYGILANMIQFGYQGKVYPVNPANQEILGLPCYPDINSVPDPIELAVIILPANQIPEIITDCGIRGIRSAIIISGGFREVDQAGAELEEKVVAIARRYDMRLIGPNCVGTVDLYSGLNTTFIKGLPERGSIGFVSQSGAVCGGVVDYIQDKGVGFSYLISLGNEADITETDMIEYLGGDPNTTVIAVYAESIKDGTRFCRVAENVGRRKPVIILKAGRSEAGARAVSSHTGSLAGSHTAYHTAFLQSGVIEVETIMDLIDISQSFSYQQLPQGNRVAIVTNSGGPAALASDSLSINGMCLADLSVGTQATLHENLLPAAQVGNPVDMLGGAEATDYAMALSNVLKDDKVDSVISILVPQAIVDPEKIANSIVEVSRSFSKPILTVMMGDKSISGARRILTSNKIPMYTFPESAGKALGMMNRYREYLNSPIVKQKRGKNSGKKLAQILLSQYASGQQLGEYESRPILDSYGIPLVRGGFARTREEAGSLADTLGYPVVMKVVSPQILHKSDFGGICLGLTDRDITEKVFEDLVKQIHSHQPDSEILGVMVEETAPKGIEVIVGMTRDPNFGPLVIFGMGGILVELITDVVFRIAPVDREEAISMISQTKVGKLLTGLRGQEPCDIDAVSKVIVRISQLSTDFPDIKEIEINPLLVLPKGEGALALDARIIL